MINNRYNINPNYYNPDGSVNMSGYAPPTPEQLQAIWAQNPQPGIYRPTNMPMGMGMQQQFPQQSLQPALLPNQSSLFGNQPVNQQQFTQQPAAQMPIAPPIANSLPAQQSAQMPVQPSMQQPYSAVQTQQPVQWQGQQQWNQQQPRIPQPMQNQPYSNQGSLFGGRQGMFGFGQQNQFGQAMNSNQQSPFKRQF